MDCCALAAAAELLKTLGGRRKLWLAGWAVMLAFAEAIAAFLSSSALLTATSFFGVGFTLRRCCCTSFSYCCTLALMAASTLAAVLSHLALVSALSLRSSNSRMTSFSSCNWTGESACTQVQRCICKDTRAQTHGVPSGASPTGTPSTVGRLARHKQSPALMASRPSRHSDPAHQIGAL